jgi:hypothetical protein
MFVTQLCFDVPFIGDSMEQTPGLLDSYGSAHRRVQTHGGRFSYLWTYNLYGPPYVMLFWATNDTRLMARCPYTGPKKVSIFRAQPPPTCPRNGASKELGKGPYQSRSIGTVVLCIWAPTSDFNGL